ncbi:hypothetical protein E2562_009685 [Oryza meyeriana var. granulata]|uniref:Epidermal patterning factor-like protein n=1 Tax=Oryza meyeriana var. granulata TaxID=110450 RepID=A0A6G1D0B0_9ORYZ|nr:hypothetical protein E2562_009685 [Oryza meyeriana var. granulata]
MRTAATPLHVAAAVFFSALLLASASRLPPPRHLPPGGNGGGEVVVAGEYEEKVRLGSSPPSCYSKCYGCSPCVAVQVPTLSAPSVPAAAAAAAKRSSHPAAVAASTHGNGDDAPLVATFTNYKPLGWKCQCRDRLFDP